MIKNNHEEFREDDRRYYVRRSTGWDGQHDSPARRGRRESPPPPPPDEFDGVCEAFVHKLWSIQWPKEFKLGPIQKYDGKINPNDWLQINSIVIRAAGGDNQVMANYLLTALDGPAWSWLLKLPPHSISSWAEFKAQFIANF